MNYADSAPRSLSRGALTCVLAASLGTATATQTAAPGQHARSPLPRPLDCNGNGIHDDLDVASGRSTDCNGNRVPDECDQGGTLLASESFESGPPPGWTFTGQWQVTSDCARPSSCDGEFFAYFGSEASIGYPICWFEYGAREGSMTMPPIDLPADATSAHLSYCSAYEGEGNDDYDMADVFVNGMLVDHVSPFPQLDWERRGVDLTPFLGQTVTIEFAFDAVDGLGNGFLGWQVDQVKVLALGPDAPADCNSNGVLDECEIDCNANLVPDDCDVYEPFEDASAALLGAYSTIVGFFPDTYEFPAGYSGGACIVDDLNMLECGNVLTTDHRDFVTYTTNQVSENGDFGPQASHMTVRGPGLFVLAAVDLGLTFFEIGGEIGVGVPAAVVDVVELSVTVTGAPYHLYLKRVYGGPQPSTNQLIIVPGDGAGLTHTYSPDPGLCHQVLSGLENTERLYYVLVSRFDGSTGLPLRPVDAQEIAREVIRAIPRSYSDDYNDNGIPDECE